MKNILITLTTLFLGFQTSFAQVCTPNSSLLVPGLFPAALKSALINAPYSETITIKLFKDTSTFFGSTKIPVQIDSMRLLAIVGMPSGFGYACLAPNCRFLPLNNTCIQISGTPIAKGIYPLKIAVRTWAKSGSFLLPAQLDTISGFSINVTDNVRIQKNQISNCQIVPNPAQSQATITNPIPMAKTIMYDLSGKIVNCIMEKQTQGLTLQVHSLKQGMYMVKHGTHTFILIKN